MINPFCKPYRFAKTSTFMFALIMHFHVYAVLSRTKECIKHDISWNNNVWDRVVYFSFFDENDIFPKIQFN